MNEKNQQLLWDLYAGIARDAKKTSGYYGNYMWVLQEMLKKPNEYHGPYAGIATNEECEQLFVAHMRVLQEMPKIPAAIMGLICRYCNECKMPTAILGFICGYCIFENLLMEFIIENDISIICLKCVYYFKTLQVM
jgi:hypothetical protein